MRLMSFNELAHRSWKWAKAYRQAKHRSDDALFAHTHCEVSEAWRECREGRMGLYRGAHGKPQGLPAELADVVIMAAMIAGKHKIDLDAAITIKFAELDKRLLEKGLR